MSASQRLAAALLLVAGALLIACQWAAVRTENVNWDEFALLSRAQETLRTGKLEGGGRLGLGTLLVIPFVDGCHNSVESIIRARHLWLGFTIAYLFGVFFLVKRASSDPNHAFAGAIVSVGLLALVPTFLRWSLQVRTDQPALMFASWAGVLLLASPRRKAAAVLAGLLFALGYLCSQKAAYVGGLVLVLFSAQLVANLRNRGNGPWREAFAIALATTSFVATIVLYQFLIALSYELPPSTTLQGAVSLFGYYRTVFGYRAYWRMLPSLAAHAVLLALLACSTVLSAPSGSVGRVTCWTVLALGFGVGVFHGGAFPYFWMTLGLFPAVAIGLSWGQIVRTFAARIERGLLFGTAGLLLVPSAISIVSRHDTERVQRDAMDFIGQNFESSATGFQAEGALLCRHDSNPFPTYFGEAVIASFYGMNARVEREKFMDEFRRRPVSFMIAHRLFRFPEAIDQFWNSHYVLYRDEVMIPGRRIDGRAGDVIDFDVIVPGTYKWFGPATETSGISVDEKTLGNGELRTLAVGVHRLKLLQDVNHGAITLAVKDDPLPPGPPFYDPQAIRELDPRYRLEFGPDIPSVR